MPSTNPFPAATLPQLKNPPIELIVGQVRVPLIPELLEPNGIAAFHSLAKLKYPHVRQESQVAIRFTMEENPRSEKKDIWKYETADHSWTLTVAPDFIALEATKYKSFAEFRGRLIEATKWYTDAYAVVLRVRVGLRYVDRFTQEKYSYLPKDWMEKINPELLLFSRLSPGTQQRTFLEQRFAFANGYGLTFRVTAVQPEDPDAKELVLDIDAFCDEETEMNDVGPVLDYMKELDHGAFAWAAKDLLSELET